MYFGGGVTLSDILQSSELNIRPIMMKLVEPLPNEVGVFLSSGIDSRCILFALLEAGKTPHAYSFTLGDRVSRDCYVAEQVSKTFGVKFTKVILPVNVEDLKSDVLILHNKYGCKLKTEYECVWPFLYAYPMVEEPVVANGIRADSHFCISKRARLHFKDDLDAYRRECFENPNGGQYLQHLQLAEKCNTSVFAPYRSQEMIDYFMGTTYEQCNKPHQKQPILNAFPEYFEKYKVYPHTNFQLGDSGIAEHFDKLLQTDWNRYNYMSVTGIFNLVNKGELNRGATNGKQSTLF